MVGGCEVRVANVRKLGACSLMMLEEAFIRVKAEIMHEMF